MRRSTGAWLDAFVIGSVIAVTLWSLHPNLVFSTSTITGGDTGAHLALPAYLRSIGNPFDLTPWYPGWFAGMPAYTYYFILPDLLATLASYVINAALAFKLATILGSVLMPIGAYLLGRLMRAPRPIPAALAAATLPFLFDASFTIDGGNLFSTMAGEYAFSLSLALALLTIGLFARGMRTGRGYWSAAIGLALTLFAHVLPFFFVVGVVGVLLVFEILARHGWGDRRDPVVPGDAARPFRFALGAGLLTAGLGAWWLLPFGFSQQLTNSMGYTNDNVSNLHAIFTTLGWYTSTGAAAGDRWVIAMAAAAVILAFIVRDYLGMVLATVTVVTLAAFVADPQGVIWNERLVPFWFIAIHLSAGWLVGYPLARWSEHVRLEGQSATADVGQGPAVERPQPADAATGATDVTPIETTPAATIPVLQRDDDAVRAHRARRALVATVLVGLAGLASTVPGLIPASASALGLSTSGNQVSSWAAWNYSGYQGKPAWPEYHDLMTTMARVGARYGCGRAMWEYSPSENRFGTTMALMLLPYWTNNCIDSMEGLFFESSATTPYHFLDQAELSSQPSNPQVGLPYGPLNIAEGVTHLQMLGVRYYIAFSPLAVAEANGDRELHLVAQTRAWPSPGVRWRIYRIDSSPLVQGLTTDPNVVAGLASRVAWLRANTKWWLDPAKWSVLAASSGPSSWPRVSSINDLHGSVHLAHETVTHVVVALQRLSFHVDRLGVPTLVKVSFYPRWHAVGATGPFRVSPNLMVVVPTSHEVTLSYGSTPATTIGNWVTDVTVGLGIVVAWFARRRRRRSRG